MMLLVTGGSASGKSAYAGKLAESLMVNKESCHREILYVATLADRSPESKRRIERHKSLRDGGCYKVAECLSMEDLRNLSVSLSEAGRKDFSEYSSEQQYPVILFDSLDGFTADVFFKTDWTDVLSGQDIFDAARDLVWSLLSLEPSEGVLIVVSDNIYEDGIRYDAVTCKYMEFTAAVEQLLAEKADCAVEVICGIPILLKGENCEFLEIRRDHDISVHKDTGSSD